MKKKNKRRAEKEWTANVDTKKKEESRITAAHNFLMEHATLDKTPQRVDVISVIKKVDTATKFKLSFWATKAKVCKPFES